MKFHLPIMRLVFVVLLLTPLMLSAQKQPAAVKPTVDQRVENLKALLSLTDDQAAGVRQILTQADAKTAAADATGKNRKAEVKALRIREKDIDTRIEALLTPEQLQKYATFKKARHDRSGTYRKGKGSEYNF